MPSPKKIIAIQKSREHDAPKTASALDLLILSILIAVALGVVTCVATAHILRTTPAGTLRGPQFATVHNMIWLGFTVEFYMGQFHSYPKTLDEMLEKVEALEKSDARYRGQHTKNTLDGWGNKFSYSSDGFSWKLTSLGADGKPGGQGVNADFFSSDKRRRWVRTITGQKCFRDATPTYVQTVQADWPIIREWSCRTILATGPIILAYCFLSKRKTRREYIEEAAGGVICAVLVAAILWFMLWLFVNCLPAD